MDTIQHPKKYMMRGNIPEKFILRPLKNQKHTQHYFSANGFANNIPKESEDFDSLNGLYNDIEQCSLLSTKNHPETGDIILDNIPIKLKIIGAFNQAYKNNGSNSTIRVLLPSGYATHITTDILFESIYKNGCDADGNLKDNFIVISNGKNMTLVRENSSLHLSCLSHMQQMKKPKMGKMTFNVGSVYKTASGAEALFLGYVTTLVPKIEVEYEDPVNENFKIKSAKYNFTNVKNATLWFPFSYYSIYNKSLHDYFHEELKQQRFVLNLKFVVGNSHSFVEISEREPISVGNVLQVIRSANVSAEYFVNKNIAAFEEQINRTKTPSPNGRNFPLYWEQLINASSYGKFLNMELFGLKTKNNHLINKIEKIWFPKFIIEHNNNAKTTFRL